MRILYHTANVLNTTHWLGYFTSDLCKNRQTGEMGLSVSVREVQSYISCLSSASLMEIRHHFPHNFRSRALAEQGDR